MARNSEKRQELFSRWDQFKKDSSAGVGTKKPFVAAECTSVNEAEKWRRDLVRDITKKISTIQNASLGEHRIRELNDEINKLMGKKHHWDIRIRELGGMDYTKSKTGIHDVEGKALPGAPFYKYYGAAKELPGVRELFSEELDFFEAKRQRRKRGDMYKNITPDYYGFRDDDDGVLAPKEAAMQVQKINESLEMYKEVKKKLEEEVQRSGGVFGAQQLAQLTDEGDESELDFLLNASRDAFHSIVSKLNPPVLTAEAAEAALMESKRQALLDQYN